MKKYFLIFISCIYLQSNSQIIKLVKDINPSGNPAISQMTLYNGKLYFSANDGIHGQELWISDGTNNGTYMLKDINPSGSSSPKELKVCNGKLYFQAAVDGGPTPSLWVSDGTEAGTIDISNNCYSPQEFTEMNEKVYFSATNNQYGTELWVTDGTKEGTKIVKNILSHGGDESSSEPTGFTAFNNKLYFVAKSGPVYFQIYESDGTESGTVIFSKFNNIGQTNKMKFFVCNGKMFFNPLENESDIGSFLYVYDETDVQKFPINGSNFSNPSTFFNWNNTLIFNATTESHGAELWKSDGTIAGTKMIKDINIGTENSNVNHFCIMNNLLYFSAADTLSNVELWVTDGIESGTKKIKEINTNAANTRQSSPAALTVFNNSLYFTARPILNQTYLFNSDGTEANTNQIDTNLISNFPSNFNPDVADLIALNDALLFTANYSNTHKKLYKVYFALSAPTALTATDIEYNSFVANWTQVENANGYFLYVSQQSDFSNYIAGYDGLFVTDTFQQVTITDNNTTYYYRVVALNNSDTSDYSNIINVEMKNSIYQLPTSSIRILPNPTSDVLRIITVNEIIKKIDFFDINGKKIYSQSINNKYAEINISLFPAGFYTAKVHFNNTFIYQKIIKH